jgi:hypothetical protein
MRTRLLLCALVTACGVGLVDGDEGEFWDETTEDAGEDGVAGAVGNKRVAVEPGKVNEAELFDELPIGQSENSANRKVVLHLGPSEIPKLAKGDRLIVPVELQVTTRCDVGQSAPGCNYNPSIRVQLILSGNGTDTAANGNGSKEIATQTKVCSKEEHHCLFVFGPETGARLDGGFNLPCVATSSCHLNLVIWAWDPQARGGGADKLIMGANEGDYLNCSGPNCTEQDRARLMVIRERGITDNDRARQSTTPTGSKSINTNGNPELVYSHPLKAGGKDLKAGEQFFVETKIAADANGRPRLAAKMFLTRDPNATSGNGLANAAPGDVTEHNGINCVGSCTVRKVGVIRVDQDIAGPVYVNVVVDSKVPGGGPGGVTVKRGDGFVKSVRYSAGLGK